MKIQTILMSVAFVGFVAIVRHGAEAVPFRYMHQGMTAPTVCTVTVR